MPRRHLQWACAATLAVVLGIPAVAEAQLFPNLPIKRQRTSCPNEPPVYRLYRHEYFGYHPTCWRPFPSGWGCPSSEAPNTADAKKEVEEIIRQQQEATVPPEGMIPSEEGQMPRPRTEGEMPQLPSGERSPFDLDRGTPRSGQPRGATPPPETAPSAVPPTAPPPETNLNAPTTPAATPPETSALDALGGRRGSLGASNAAPLSLLDVGHPTSPRVTASVAELPPFPDMPQPSNPGTVLVNEPAPSAPAPIVEAPQRRGLLSGLFQRWNRVRR